jgi:hypothetical protein
MITSVQDLLNKGKHNFNYCLTKAIQSKTQKRKTRFRSSRPAWTMPGFVLAALLAFAVAGTLLVSATHNALDATPAAGTIGPPSSVSFDAPARAGAATGPGDCLGANCSDFLLTVQNPGGLNVRVRLDWSNVANDYDMYIYKQGPGEPQVASSGNGTTTFEETVFTPEASTTYQIVIVHFAATGVGTMGPENIHGVASLVSPPTVVSPNRIGPTGTGIVFSPNGNTMTSAGEAPTGLGTVMAPETIRDGEPSIRADVRGNVYPAGIRGVPAGVDVWRYGPNAFCPRFTFHRTSEFPAAGTDPPSNPSNPNAGYVWLGQPDGIFVTGGEGSPDAGGGDIEITTSFPSMPGATPTLSMVSLTLANITSASSSDRGNNWTPANPVAATVPIDDRQWIEAYGQNTVYLYYRTLATLTGLVLNKSIDGGVSYAASTSIVNPSGLTPGWIDVDQTPNSNGSVDIYLSGQNSSRLAVFHCVDPTPNVPSVISCTESTVDDTMSHGHLFDVVSVDNADNVYAAWSNNQDIFYAYSTNKGASWSAPVKVTNAGSGGGMPNFNFFPWITAGDNGRLGIVWYGTDKTTNADNDAEWKAYYAFTSNARAAVPTIRWLAASDHVIHKSNVSQAGLSTEGAVNRNLIDFFQVAHDPRDGAAVIAFADDHNDFDGATYYTRQIAGPGLRQNRTPTQPFCPALPPLSNPEVIDLANDEGSSFGAGTVPDADILSVDYGSQTVGSNLFLTADIRVTAMLVAPVQRSYRAYFAVNTVRGLMDGGNEYFVEVTTESGTPQFFLGVVDRRADGTTHELRLTQAQENITADNPGSPFVTGTPGIVKLRVNANRLNWTFGADGTPTKGTSPAPGTGSLVIGLRARTRVATLAASSVVDTTRGGSFIILGAPNGGGGGGGGGCGDNDDFDHDGIRDDVDNDDDNDGIRDDVDNDDDNDGRRDDVDDDDDNDCVSDRFDNQSTRDEQSSSSNELAVGQVSDYLMEADSSTLSVTGAAANGQALVVEIYDPQGVLIAKSLSAVGSAVVTAPVALPGNYTIRFRNVSTTAVTSTVTMVRSSRWP